MRWRGAAARFRLGLTVVGIGVAAVGIGLATAASQAASARHALAIEGELLRLGSRVERDLRESGPDGAAAILDANRTEGGGRILALELATPAGETTTRVGGPTSTGAREIELFLGRAWTGGGPAESVGTSPGSGAGAPQLPGTSRGPGGGLGLGPPTGRGGGAGRGPRFGTGPSATAGEPGAGGGRRVLRVTMAHEALRQPAAERALLPAAVAFGLLVVGGAYVLGRALDRQRAEASLEGERRRLAALGRAGAGLAHQLRTPLATLKGRIQLLLESGAAPGDPRLAQLLAQGVRMERLLDRLLDFARPPEAQREVVELAEPLRELAARTQRVVIADGPAPPVVIDPDHLRQVLDNLVDNALAATPGGSVEIAVRAAGRERVVCEIADQGPGPGADPERLFEPYVTGRADGTGLGLPIARALAQANGATLSLAPRPGGGTVAVLTLERARKGAP